MLDVINQLLLGFQELKLNQKKSDDFFEQAFTRTAARLRRITLRIGVLQAQTYSLVYGVWIGLLLTSVILLPRLDIISPDASLTLVRLIFFLSILSFVEYLPQGIVIAMSAQHLFQCQQQLQNIVPESKDDRDTVAPPCFKKLVYQGIHFHYSLEGHDRFAVGPLSFVIHPGDILFLTGGNGSGKTTLIKLLTGLYAPHAGQVLLNDEPAGAPRYRTLFAPVFSDVHLFDRLYGLKNIDEQRVNELLALMQIDYKVQYRDGCFTTLDLSTGQKKRLALVCVILEDRPIYVFDEWAAEQDPEFRRYFYEILLPGFKAQGKTVIAITHDDRWFHVADQVLKMENGQIEVREDQQKVILSGQHA